jgi:8-oxo-(d)GTP phosphatase
MYLFINDIPVTILRPEEEPEADAINFVLDAATDNITKATLINHVWIRNAGITHIDLVLELINSQVPLQLISLHISVKDYRAIKAFLRRKFKVVKAAGGLVMKKDRYLMIFRMKKWDLPKGKKDPGETSRQTAEREVREECGIAVKVGKPLVTTWHTYTMNRSNMLKRTRWYQMELVDDTDMKPAVDEDIEELRWMTSKEVYHALENSYNSIRFVFKTYYDKVSEKA